MRMVVAALAIFLLCDAAEAVSVVDFQCGKTWFYQWRGRYFNAETSRELSTKLFKWKRHNFYYKDKLCKEKESDN